MLKERTWSEIRNKIKVIAPQLADIIDSLSPSNKLTFIEAKYRYGDLILCDGNLQLPENNNKLVPLAKHTEKTIIKKLTYSTIPTFITAEKCNEIFIDTGNRIIPLNLFYPGSIFGLLETFDSLYGRNSDSKWSISAGARSTFILAKVYEAASFKRLSRAFHLLSAKRLMHLTDHWDVFKGIAQHQDFKQAWVNEIIFFSDAWFENFKKNDPAWMPLYHYLMKNAWHQAQFLNGKIDFKLYWEYFMDIISEQNLKATPYISDQIKHIMLIAAGQLPGFRSADNSQLAAPIQGIQDAFIDIYQLKKYLPIIMHPHLFKARDNFPVYYSLAHPTLLEGSPHRKNKSTVMLDIKEIKMLFDLSRTNQIKKTKFIPNLFDKVKLDYFHVENDPYQEILSSSCIPDQDPEILADYIRYPEREFCPTSPYWRGSIKISLLKDL